jgi:CRP/FNR family transcriptional regulator, anaerobic regulatory protein
MQATDKLFSMLDGIRPISDGLRNHLESILEVGSFKKKEHLLKIGQVCRKVTFVLEGLIRCYYIDDDGNEICSWFMKEGDVIIAVESHYRQTLSREAIQTLENTRVCFIYESQLQETCELYPEFYYHTMMLTRKYQALFDREKCLLRSRKDPWERMELMLEIFPDLRARVAKKYIASYLGISHYALSRRSS